MKPKKVYLVAALLLTGCSPLLMTSCAKDYDGQIEILKNMIKNGDVNLTNLTEKIALIEKQIATLQEAVKEHAELRTQIEQLTQQLNQTKAELEQKIKDLQDAMDKNDQNVKDLIEAARQEFDKKLSDLSDRIDQEISAKYNDLDGRVKKLEEQYASLQEKQEATEKAIEGITKEIADLKDTQAEEKQKLQKALEDLQTLDQKLTDNLATIDQKLKDLEQAAKDNAANLETLRRETTESITNLKNEVDGKIADINNALAGLSDSVNDLQDTVNNLNTKYDNLDSRITELIKSYDRQIEELWAAINKGGGSTDLTELNKLVAEIQKNLGELNTKVEDLNKKYLDLEALYGRMDKVEDIVNDHETRIRSLETKMDALGIRVSELEGQVKDMKQLYDVAIKDIQNRLEALEKGGVPPVDLKDIKDMLNNLQTLVNQNTNDILQLKGDQQAQAGKLATLESKVDAFIIAMNQNYNQLLEKHNLLEGRVDELYKELQDALAKIPDVGELKEAVLKNQKDIADLQIKYNELSGKLGDFVTAEDVEKMLADYYNKTEIDNLLADVYKQLDTRPNRDEVNQMIEEATKNLNAKLAEMEAQIQDLKDRVDALETKVDQLFKRIQSMVVVPQYAAAQQVELTPATGNNYTLTVKVKVNPANALAEMVDLKSYFTVDSREALVSRAVGDAGPAFTVTDVAVTNANAGIVTVKAVCTLATVDPQTITMPFVVAVGFRNSNNDRSTDYVGVRFVPASTEDSTEYKFYSGTDLLNTKEGLDLSLFAENEIYKLPVLSEQRVLENVLTQIDGSQPIFEKTVLGSSQEVEANKDIPVIYDLAAIYNENGTPVTTTLANYIAVSPQTGELFMKNNLTPGVTSSDLTGYKVIVLLQSRKDGANFGQPAYVCVELQKK